MTYQEFLYHTGSNDSPLTRQYFLANQGGQMPIGSELVEGGNFGDTRPMSLAGYGRTQDLGFGQMHTGQPVYDSYPQPYIAPSNAPTSVMAPPNASVASSAPPSGDFFGGDDVESITGDEGGLLGDSAPPAEDPMTSGQGHAWGMVGNTAGNMIDTRDKELVGGTKGSQSGYMKGALKGAGTGATIGTMIAPGYGTAVGGAIGGTLGLLGASQGYFDSRTPPQTTIQTVTPIRGGSGFSGHSTSLFG